MLSKNVREISVGMLVTVFCILGYIVLIKGQTSTNTNSNTQTKSRDQLIAERKSVFPVINYWEADSSDESQNRRGQKYDRFSTINPNITANASDAAITHWQESLTSRLPVDTSQVIVSGEVVEAKANLSPNKCAVYSDFKIKIDQVYKNETAQKLSNGSFIIGERTGGIVRFSSGFEYWVYVVGQSMPVTKKRYLFFLTYNSPELKQKTDLFILTAFEIANGKVKPLDDVDGDNATTYFRNKDTAVLFEDLAKRLTPTEKED